MAQDVQVSVQSSVENAISPVVASTISSSVASTIASSVASPIPINSSGQTESSPAKNFGLELPFAGVAGRCFMRVCQIAEWVDSWIRANQPPARDQLKDAAVHQHDWHVAGWLRSWVGALCCTAVAAFMLPVFWTSSWQSFVPFIFLVVISYTAVRFGAVAGVFGTISAALIFASVLFEPRPSLAIDNPAARNHLISMIIIGICASEFLGRRKAQVVYKPWW